MLKVVFDTNIFLQALINPHGINARLVAEFHKYELIISEEIIAEILNVLFRSSLRKKYSSLNNISIQELFYYISAAKVVRPKDKISACRDAKDNKFLECAVAAAADYLVSGDKDLLDMGEYKGVKIISAGPFIEKIRT
jgi:putative PIN family toxin of toxin-antitoxin system